MTPEVEKELQAWYDNLQANIDAGTLLRLFDDRGSLSRALKLVVKDSVWLAADVDVKWSVPRLESRQNAQTLTITLTR